MTSKFFDCTPDEPWVAISNRDPSTVSSAMVGPHGGTAQDYVAWFSWYAHEIPYLDQHLHPVGDHGGWMAVGTTALCGLLAAGLFAPPILQRCLVCQDIFINRVYDGEIEPPCDASALKGDT